MSSREAQNKLRFSFTMSSQKAETTKEISKGLRGNHKKLKTVRKCAKHKYVMKFENVGAKIQKN